MLNFIQTRKMSFIFLLILLIQNNNIISKLIIFPFKTINTKLNSSNDFMSKLYSNELYTNLKLGSSKIQTIPTIISQKEVAFSINENSYHLKNSSNYNESTFPKPRSFVWENIEGVLLEDILYINSINKTVDKKIKEEKFNSKFIYVDEQNQTSSYIGLNFPDLYEHNVISIFKTLKDNKLIDNYQWCPKINHKNDKKNIEYIDWLNLDGELIIGGNCHDYIPETFKKNYISEFEMYSHGQYVEYNIKFQNIYVGDDPTNDLYYNQVFFGINFLTIGSLEYETKIANSFFNDWVEKDVCFVESINISKDIHYYYCDISLDKEKKFNINLLPKLCLEISNTTFCFNYNDLFVKDPNNENILYFIIAFMKFDPISDYPRYFHFGLQFLSKYQLSFDPKNKIIYYFGLEEYNKKKENKSSYKYVYYIIIIVVLAIILVALGMILQKYLTKTPRKFRANELTDDNFLYEEKTN